MRIAHINFDYGLAGIGGASVAASRLHNSLLDAGVDSWFLCNHQREAGRNVVEVPSRGSLYRIVFIYGGKILRNFWRLSTLRKAVSLNLIPSGIAREINKLKPDIVHIQWVCPDVLSWRELKKIQAPMIVALHDLWMLNGFAPHPKQDNRYVGGFQSCNSGFVERFLFGKKVEFSKAHELTFVGPSEWVRQCAEKSLVAKHQQCKAIPNLIDTTVFKYDADKRTMHEKLVILFGGYGGTKNPYKGFDDLMAALNLLPNTIKSVVELHVFGEQADDCLVDGIHVHFLGCIRDVHELVEIYQGGDVLAFPSKQETQGQIKIEAMACGLPVVAFDRTACAEGILHQKTGWVAQDGDARAFKDGILWCYEMKKNGVFDNTFRAQISQIARANYGQDVIVKKWLELYLEKCRSGNKRQDSGKQMRVAGYDKK